MAELLFPQGFQLSNTLALVYPYKSYLSQATKHFVKCQLRPHQSHFLPVAEAYILSGMRRFASTFIQTFTLLATLTAAAMLCIALFVVSSTARSIYSKVDDVPHEEAALVLGASIRSNGTLSVVLQERADAAIALYAAHKVSKILVSGDNSTLHYNEVYPVGKYLTSKGVPTADIFLDYAGFDTYSSMYRAKAVFGVTSMIITSQRFHLPRAICIARSLGIQVVGLDAAGHSDSYFLNALREIPATTKAMYDLFTHRTPRYLGPTFFVTGDGSATWVGPKAEAVYFIDE